MAIRTRNGWLSLYFRCYLPDGRRVLCSESLKLKDTQRNRKLAEDKDRAIGYHLKNGSFDYLAFFPHGSKAKHFRARATDITMSEWWEEWREGKSTKSTTAQHYEGSWRNHIEPHFGSMLLSDIREQDILIFRKVLQGKGYKASSVNQITKTLCSLLRVAARRGLIAEYVCEEVSVLAESRPDVDPFSFDELRHLFSEVLQKAPEWHELLFIWSRTGLRPGELYALKWGNVDFFNSKLLVRESRMRSGEDGTPKTKHSVRDIDLRPQVITAFKRQYERTGLHDKYVFTNTRGRALNQAFFSRKFRYLLKLAGMRDRPPKNMRHTFATLHIAAGESITWVSRMLGHADVQITLRRYNRYIPNLTREDGSAFERAMDAQKDGKRMSRLDK